MSTTDPTPQTILYAPTAEDGVATITLNRPAARNAVGPAEWLALRAVIEQATATPGLRALLLTGAGGAFCAGGDLRTIPERLAQPPGERAEHLRAEAQAIRKLYELDVPVVAAIAGACAGAGLGLALACDLRVAADDARFGAAFHRVGLGSDFGVTWLLPRVVGPARAAELMLLADPVDASQALALGLCSRVVPAADVDREARALAARLAAGPGLAQAFTKRGLRRALTGTLDELLEWEALAQAVLSKTADAAEGIAAFREKRPPRFLGR